MFASVAPGQFSESEASDNVGRTCEDLGYDGHAEVQSDASVKIAEVLVLGKIDDEAVGESDSDEWRCYGDSVEKSSFSGLHIYDLYHEHGKDDKNNDENSGKECNCGFALWVQNEWVFGFAGFDPAIDPKAHPGKTEDADALENHPGYWARNESVSVRHIRSDLASFRRERLTL